VTGLVPSFVRRRRVAQKLRAAADLLATGGWVQCVTYSLDRHCMVGAIAATPDTQDDQLYPVAVKAVSEHLGIAGHHLARWNDQPGRTAEQVIAALRETADEEDARAACFVGEFVRHGDEDGQ
jgi:hypothetical protein